MIQIALQVVFKTRMRDSDNCFLQYGAYQAVTNITAGSILGIATSNKQEQSFGKMAYKNNNVNTTYAFRKYSFLKSATI